MSNVNAEYPTQTLRLTNVISYALLIAVNVASNSGLLGPTNAEISQKYSTPLTPAGWAFSIWGLIFALEGLGVIYAALPHGYNEGGWKERTVNAIGYSWQACWLFECLWQLLFLVQTPLGMVACMICLLSALASMLFGLSRLYACILDLLTAFILALPPIGYHFSSSPAPLLHMQCARLNRGQGSLPSILLSILFFMPTSINAAWLSVASGLGVLIVPLSYGHTAHLEAGAAITAAVATAAGLLTLQCEKDTAYGLTLVWSLVAVYAKHKHVQSIMVVSLIGIVLLGVASAAAIVQKQRQRKYSPMHGGLGESLQG